MPRSFARLFDPLRSARRLLALVACLAGCDDEPPPDATAGSTGTSGHSEATTDEATMEPGTTDGGSTEPSGSSDPSADSTGDSGDTTGEPDDDTGSEGSDSSGGLPLEGDPPAPASYSAIDDRDFERLGDDDDFTDFTVDGNRLQIPPLRDANFPPGTDYCTVGSDEQLNELQQWARARLQSAVAKTWYYDVAITTVAEEDGESEFALVVNGEVVETLRNPVTDEEPGVGDMDDFVHTWTMIPLLEGDVVEVWGKAHSNLVLEEGAGCRQWSPTYAWARGRWRQLDLSPTPGVGE